jgi:hypothetical protein
MPSLPVSPGVSRFGTLPPGLPVNEQNLPVFTSDRSRALRHKFRESKKCKRYKQLVLKSSKCINCTEVKRHSANHVVLTLTPEVNIVGINYLMKFVQFCCEISIGFAVPHSTVPALIPGGLISGDLSPGIYIGNC